MSEKIRMEFEEWFYEYSLPCEGDWFKRDSRGDYDYPSTHDAWMGWQASRSALVVELPSDINGEYYADGWNAALMCVEGMLEEAGVSYK